MPRLTKFEVRPAKGGGWQGVQGGKSVVTAATKDAAMRETIALAKAQPAASVIIKGRDGRIKEERTYPRGADPRRSKG